MTHRTQLVATLWTASLALCLLGCGESSSPDEAVPTTPATQPAATQPAASATDLPPSAKATNTHCPMSKQPVTPGGRKVAYKGEVYGFCCDECAEPFKAAPQKYARAD